MNGRRSTQRSLLPWQVGTAVAVACSLGLAMQNAVHRRDAIGPADDYGRVLPGQTAIDLDAPVQQRTGCRIARFGMAPYNAKFDRGAEWQRTTRAALLRMGLPLDAANQAVQRLRDGWIDDTVGIGSRGAMATASRQIYLPVFSTTYRQDGVPVVCHDSRATFLNPNRLEAARLLVIPTQQGTFHIAEILACGNVSRLIPGDVPDGIQPLPLHTVPEPGTWGLMLLGLLAMVAFGKRRSA